MIKLIKSGLFGNRLISVSTPEMVDRYNACLRDIGLKETKLSTFHIDGWGWSPQIADELNDRYYLCHGIANPYAIIISPSQKDCSLYFPIHSFDWEIHQLVFKKYHKQITELTTKSGVWFELDQEISTYRSAKDLLLIENISITFKSAANLMQASEKQKVLVQEFNDKALAWHDADLRDAIIDSAKEFGDLRFTSLDMPPLNHTQIESFYTPGFGGVYVIHNTNVGKPLMIFEQLQSELSGKQGHSHIEFNIGDPKLLPFLFANQLISDDTQFYKKQTFLLEHELLEWLVKAGVQDDENADFISLTSAKKKGLVNRLFQNKVLSEEYFNFENIIRDLKKSTQTPKINDALREHFVHPSKHLDKQTKTVMWQIISRLFKNNDVLFYTFNKTNFYVKFQTWSPNYQDWIIAQIKKHQGIYNQLIS